MFATIIDQLLKAKSFSPTSSQLDINGLDCPLHDRALQEMGRARHDRALQEMGRAWHGPLAIIIDRARHDPLEEVGLGFCDSWLRLGTAHKGLD